MSEYMLHTSGQVNYIGAGGVCVSEYSPMLKRYIFLVWVERMKKNNIWSPGVKTIVGLQGLSEQFWAIGQLDSAIPLGMLRPRYLYAANRLLYIFTKLSLFYLNNITCKASGPVARYQDIVLSWHASVESVTPAGHYLYCHVDTRVELCVQD